MASWFGALLTGWLFTRTQALVPGPIKWGGLRSKNLILATKASPDNVLVAPQKLVIWDPAVGISTHVIDHFTANRDQTISLQRTSWCIEASGNQIGDEVRTNRCTASPLQKWNWVPNGRGEEMIQLMDTSKCLDAGAKEGALNEAPIELRECNDKLTQQWEFEEAAHVGDPVPASSFLLRHFLVSCLLLATLGALSLSIWSWQQQRKARSVFITQGVTPLSADHGDVPLTVRPSVHWDFVTFNTSLTASMQELSPATMCVSPLPAGGDNRKEDAVADEKVQNVDNFLSKIMAADLQNGKHSSIITRFPPEPNGYLHIGHAKSICINFGLAQRFDGATFMRFDDTNPEKEEQEYIDAIMNDVKWLGFSWKEPEQQTYASDYFDKFYQYALKLITDGKAYVESLNADEMREYRGTLTKKGIDSPHRTRSVEENLQLFAKMAAGEVPDGEMCVRLKIDMQSPNIHMRDPTIYRIKRDAVHPRTGTTWKIYPMYDFAHVLTDCEEFITHSLCTLEFEDHRPLYEWIRDEVPVPSKPRQIEFSRLNLQYCVVSKRKLMKLVTEGHVNGWDDPRMPTLCGLRRRGVPAEALRLFVERTGVSKADNNIDYFVLEDCVREILEQSATRAFAVLDPIRVVVTTWPEGEVDMLEGPMHPKLPELGKRQMPFSRNLLIDRDDFTEDPPPKYRRLKPGGEVRLRFGYVIKVDEVIKDAAGKVIELHCSHKPDTRQGAGKGFNETKVKGIIHWLSEDHCRRATVNVYDRLFKAPSPGADHEDGDFLKDINPDSLKLFTEAAIEPYAAESVPGVCMQFERTGYFCVDQDSAPDNLIFNRTVTLRDTWASK